MNSTHAAPATTVAVNRVEDLAELGQSAFVGLLGEVFEHSAWIAEAAWAQRPFRDVDALHAAMTAAMRSASQAQQLALIRAHPELAGRAAASGALTAASSLEQRSAGLDNCSPADLQQLRALNADYFSKFGFPFVLAVRRRSRQEILANMAARMGNGPEQEFEEALQQIESIAWLRLQALFPEG